MKYLFLISFLVCSLSALSSSFETKVIVKGTCSDFKNTYSGEYNIIFSKAEDNIFVITLENKSMAQIQKELEEYADKLLAQISKGDYLGNLTLEDKMEMENPRVSINEMSLDIYKRNNWDIKSVHVYDEDEEGNIISSVRGNCKFKVTSRESRDSSFLNSYEKIHFLH